MQFLPHILVRKSGLPMSRLDRYRHETDWEKLYALLKTDIQEEVFQQALPFSSLDFVQFLPCFLQKEVAQFKKKDLQKARTALKYLTRTAAKCSPFAQLTTLGMYGSNKEATQQLHINLQVFAYFQQAIIADPTLRNALPIQLNPTLIKDQNEFKWLFYDYDNEYLQSAEDDGLLLLIIQDFDNQYFNYNDFMAFAKKKLGRSRQTQHYIEQLFAIGILAFQFPFTKNQEGLNTLLTWLNQPIFANNTTAQQLHLSLQKLLDTVKNGVDFAFFKQFSQKTNEGNMPLSAERIAYLDVSHQVENTDFEPQLTKVLQRHAATFAQIVRLLTPLYFDRLQAKVAQLLATAPAMPLMSLFEKICITTPDIDITVAAKTAQQRRNDFELFLNDNIDYKGDTIVITQQLLEKAIAFTAKMPNVSYHTLPKSYNLIFQPATDGTAYLSGASIGYGKQFLRFLHLFDYEAVTFGAALNQQEVITLALNDNSLISANEHPPIAAVELAMPNSLSKQPTLRPNELWVQCDAVGNLQVTHFPTGKKVLPLDLGLEHPNRRALLYQLLACFGESLPKTTILSTALNNIHERLRPEVLWYPRISINGLIIQRKHWFLDVTKIPKRQKQQPKTAYITELQQWAIDKGLPIQCYISVPMELNQTPNENRLQADDYKPQYIDFQNVLLVELFSKIINRVPDTLKVEEAYPAASQLFTHQQQPYMMEMVCQINRV